jgi:uncharacterized protein YoxC
MPNIRYILAFIVIAVIAVIAVKSCVDIKETSEKSQVLLDSLKSQVATIEYNERKANELFNAAASEVERLQEVAAVAMAEKENVELSLDKTEQRVRLLSDRIRNERTDTVMLIANCDSLVEENMNLIGLIHEYEHHTDAITGLYEEQLAIKDSMINNRQNLYADLRISFDKLASDHVRLIQSKPNTSRWSRWIKPLITAVVAGAIVNELKK